MKAKQIILSIIRIAIGLFFVATAILKILSIKEFELYIYSYGLFNYTLCTLIARCLIAFELCAGLCLALRWWYRLSWWILQISLVGFTIFLIFAQLRGDENCHCLGDFVELNPIESMIKNIAIMLILIFVRNQENWKFKFGKLIKPLIVIVVAAVPFIATPPELLYGKLYSTDRNINTVIFEKALTDSTFTNVYPRIHRNTEYDSTTFKTEYKDFNLKGKNVLIFALTECKYCHQGVKRLAMFCSENRIRRSNCKVLISGGAKGVLNFIKETDAYGFEFIEIPIVTSINIIDGKFPTFVLMENDSIIKSFDLWGLEENVITDFFKEE